METNVDVNTQNVTSGWQHWSFPRRNQDIKKKNHKQVICNHLKWIKIDEIKSKLVVVCGYEWVDTLSASVEGSNKGFKENGRQ